MTIEVPPGVHYTCTQCGDCCRRFSILLGPGERERIEGLDWTGKRPELVGAHVTERIKEPGFEGRYRLVWREGSTCIFLGERNQCMIHEHFGEETKPLICRLYPFAFISLGKRVCLDVSFACRAVSHEHGEPVGERTPEWNLLTAHAPPGESSTSRTLRKGVPVSGDLLWEIEGYLLGFLMDRSMSMYDRIRCVLQFLRLATTGNPNAPTSREFRDAMAVGVVKQVRERLSADATLDRTQRAMFYQWLYVALNPIPAGFHSLPSVEQKKERDRRVAAGAKFREQQDPPRIDDRELNCSFDDVRKVPIGILQRDEMTLPQVYLCAKIIGQRFTQLGKENQPLYEGLHRLLLSYPMLVWASKALAADRGAPEVEREDVRAAIRILDRFTGHVALFALSAQIVQTIDTMMSETDLVLAAMNDTMGR